MQKPKTNARKNSRKTVVSRGKRMTTKQSIFSSLVAMSEHKHTGKRLHHRHTSHGALLAILLVTGILIFLNFNILRASGPTTVAVTVTGAAPTVSAVITSPTTGSTVTEPLLTVSGTCPESTLVAIYDNGTFAGSTVCTSSNLFQLTIQLQPGTNILQAQNYDGLNQPGPVTPQVAVFYQLPGETTPPATQLTTGSKPPVSPAPQPAENPCYEYPVVGTMDHTNFSVIVSCIIHSVSVGQAFQLPITIIGGTSPYALSVDWGDEAVDLKSLTAAGLQNLTHTYSSAGTKQVKLRVTDAAGATYFIQMVVEVNGIPPGSPAGGIIQNIGLNLQRLWIEVPVPLYWVAVAVTIGFWIGDLFDRKFGQTKQKRRHA